MRVGDAKPGCVVVWYSKVPISGHPPQVKQAQLALTIGPIMRDEWNRCVRTFVWLDLAEGHLWTQNHEVDQRLATVRFEGDVIAFA